MLTRIEFRGKLESETWFPDQTQWDARVILFDGMDLLRVPLHRRDVRISMYVESNPVTASLESRRNSMSFSE